MITVDLATHRMNLRPAARRPLRRQVGLVLLTTNFTAVAADANATQFGFVTQNQDSDYYIINADVQILAPGGRVGFVRLSNVRLLRDRSEAGITVGYRMEF